MAGKKKNTAANAAEKCKRKTVGAKEAMVSGESQSDENTNSDVSSDEEEVIGAVGMWSSASRKGQKGNKVVYICAGGKKQCGKVIEGKEKCIMCESCGGWFHPHCQDLSTGALDALEVYKLPWVCISCLAEIKEKRRLERRIDRQIEIRMKNMEKVIKEQMDKTEERLTQKFTETKQQTTAELDQKIVEGLKNVETHVTKEIGRSSDSVKKVVTEQERKLDRSHNVIIHNVPEGEEGTAADKKGYIQKKVMEITKAICGCDSDLKIERAFRLQGREVRTAEQQARPRLLLVRFEKKEHADLVLQKRFGLREAGFPNTYINRDLPREEREKERQLRQELREKGRDTHMIFRGRVVLRSEQ